MTGIVSELRRRNVFRVAAAYLAGAWLLIQIIEVLFPIFSLSPATIRLVVILLAVGFVPAVIVAWVFEWTPGGIRRESEAVAAGAPADRKATKSLDRIIMVVLALALGLFAFDKFVLAPEREAALVEDARQAGAEKALEEVRAKAAEIPQASVAVLPFVNMSGDANNEYFSDGLTETVLHMLAQLPDLKVSARTSSFAFKDKNVDVRTIGTTLGVAHVLEGSVQKAGERVRITAQLVRANDGFHVWSQNYDLTLDDIFAVQDQISTDVALELGSSLLDGRYEGIRGVDTTNFSAYDIFLKALEQQHINTNDALLKAESLFRQTIEKDPDFADAKLGLARNHLWMRWKGIGEGEEYLAAKSLLEEVLAQRPDDLTARVMDLIVDYNSGYAKREDAWGPEPALEALVDDMVALVGQSKGNIDPFVLRELVALLRGQDRDEETIDLLRDALKLDPLNFELLWAQANALRGVKRLDESKQALLTAMQIAPDNPLLYFNIAGIGFQEKNWAEGFDWLRKAVEVDPSDPILPGNLAGMFYIFGLREQGDPWLARAQALSPDRGYMVGLEMRSAFLAGDDERLRELTESALPLGIAGEIDVFWAIQLYVVLMSSRERAREGLDFLSGLLPGIEDYTKLAGATRSTFYTQGISSWLQQYVMDQKSYRQLMETYVSTLEAAGIPWRVDGGEANGIAMDVSVGKLDDARRLFLEESGNWLMNSPQWWQVLNYPWLEEFRQDPEVAARLAEHLREKEQIRAALLEMVQRPEWQL
jgi:TolB-like protein/Tfp pilus assembly protein PilF